MATSTSEPRCLPRGTVLFRQGDPGHEMFVLSDGHVRLTLHVEGHDQALAVLGPGDFFGELSLLTSQPRTATATVVEDATLVAIDRAVFAMMMQDDLDIVFRMMNVLGRRLSETDQQVHALRRELEHLRSSLSRGTPSGPAGA